MPETPATPNLIPAKLELCWDHIKYLDERVAGAFDIELKDVLRDLQNRPTTLEARTITLKVDIVPVPQDDGSVDAKLVFRVLSSKPVRKSREHIIALQHNQPRGYFHADIDDPRQAGLFDHTQVPAKEAAANQKKPD